MNDLDSFYVMSNIMAYKAIYYLSILIVLYRLMDIPIKFDTTKSGWSIV